MHARAATRTGGTGSICSEERILCKHGDGPLTCLTALTYKSGYFFLCNAEHERAVVVRASPAMAATQQHPSWEFTVVVLSGPGATTDIIGAAEAKGMQLVALHAAAGTAVVAFCTLRKGVGATLARLLPPSGCLRVYETAAAAQQAVRVASCGGASLCCAITGEAIDASDAASDGSSGGGGGGDAGGSGSGAAGSGGGDAADGNGAASAAAASASAAAASAALAGLHACSEDSGSHRALLALLRSHGAPRSPRPTLTLTLTLSTDH